jgi:hypothetical protein
MTERVSLSVKISQATSREIVRVEEPGLPTSEDVAIQGELVEEGGPLWKALSAPPPSVANLIHQVLTLEKTERRFLRPSGFGGCPRSQLFQYQQVPATDLPQPDNGLQLIFGVGTKLHEMLQNYLAQHPGVFFSPETPVWIPELNIKGSCDGILSLRTPDANGLVYRWGVEFKTISSRGFEALRKPKPEHVVQASIYARLAGVYWISIVYFNKDSHQMKEYPVSYSATVWEGVIRRVEELMEHDKRKTLPVYSTKVCQQSVNLCSHVTHCHRVEGVEPPAWWNGSRKGE